MKLQLDVRGKVKLPLRIVINGELHEIKSLPYTCIVLESANNSHGFDLLHSWLGERLHVEKRERLYQFLYVNRFVKIKDVAYVLSIDRQVAKELVQKLTDEHAIGRYATIWVREKAYGEFLTEHYATKESTHDVGRDQTRDRVKRSAG